MTEWTGATRRSLLAAAALATIGGGDLAHAGAPSPTGRRVAPRPPMGWNSWDSFGATINEAQAHETAAIMAKTLLPHGYDVFTIDIQWYEPGATGFDYRKDAPLVMDGYGRLLPAPNRFPSAANGAGFKPMADHVHSLGLKFGVHLLRGVPRLAVERRLPVLGAEVTAADIADRNSICAWNGDMYGVNMRRPGAQAYYDSVFALLAAWGVDFVKVDDMSRPYDAHRPEIVAVRKAIDASGRPMTLSLSPGPTPVPQAFDVRRFADMSRISDDFWDSWPLLMAQFERLAAWAPFAGGGYWPDADMLPLGLISLGQRTTRFTPDEQITLMTLWSIARSPLIMGGDLRQLDKATLDLLTNDEVLAANQSGAEPRQVYSRNGLIAWTSRSHQGRDRYLALFNTGDLPAAVPAPLADLGMAKAAVRDLWRRANLGPAPSDWAPQVPAHGATMYRLSSS
jgi:hypothetical protein